MTEAVVKKQVLSTLIVDDEPLAVERMQVICSRLDCLRIVGTAGDLVRNSSQLCTINGLHLTR